MDESAVRNGVVKASEFAEVYERVLEDGEVRGRVRVDSPGDIKNLKWEKKF